MALLKYFAASKTFSLRVRRLWGWHLWLKIKRENVRIDQSAKIFTLEISRYTVAGAHKGLWAPDGSV